MRLNLLPVCTFLTFFALLGCAKNVSDDEGDDTSSVPVDTSTPDLSDQDNDGVTSEDGDCDDNDASVYPGADDSAGDGIDQNCDGTDGVDEDGDGWAS